MAMYMFKSIKIFIRQESGKNATFDEPNRMIDSLHLFKF